MSTLREACDEDDKIAPLAILKQTVAALQQECVAIDTDLHRLAVRQHYHMQKVGLCLRNLEKLCGLH